MEKQQIELSKLKALEQLETVEQAEKRMSKLMEDSKLAKPDSVTIGEDKDTGILNLLDYSCVKKFKSIRRAIRRGHVTSTGMIIPHRPFNNTPIRNKRGVLTVNGRIKKFYEQVKYSRGSRQ